MAAPSIPNLLAGRGSSRRTRRAPAGGTPSVDAVIQDTDTDAAVSRLSAVSAGYLDDAYAHHFVTHPTRRLPIINRGTYVRTRALDRTVAGFLSRDAAAKQIISLGAGTDTRPFRILGNNPGRIVYHEVDFEATCRRKLAAVMGAPALARRLVHVEQAGGGSWRAQSLHGDEYFCHAADLRALGTLADSRGTTTDSLGTATYSLGTTTDTPAVSTLVAALRPALPTLLVSECCLCYLTPVETQRIISFFAARLPRLACVIYEPMPLDDAFGAVMLSNLRARNILMPSVEHYRNAAAQERRLRQAGFPMVGHMSVAAAWQMLVSEEEKDRLAALEQLDEVEEWDLLAAHYVVAWASRDASLGDLDRYTCPPAPCP